MEVEKAAHVSLAGMNPCLLTAIQNALMYLLGSPSSNKPLSFRGLRLILREVGCGHKEKPESSFWNKTGTLLLFEYDLEKFTSVT